MATIFCEDKTNIKIEINATDNATLQDLFVPADQRIHLMINFAETVKSIKSRLSDCCKVVFDVCISDKSSFSANEVALLGEALMEKPDMPQHYQDMFNHVINNATASGFKFDSVETGIMNAAQFSA